MPHPRTPEGNFKWDFVMKSISRFRIDESGSTAAIEFGLLTVGLLVVIWLLR